MTMLHARPAGLSLLILLGAACGSARAEPVGFNGLMITNLSQDYTYYSAGNPNAGATRNSSKSKNLTVGFQVFERGTLLTSSTFLSESCKQDGASQSPSFAYKIGGNQNESFNCTIRDEFSRGSFRTRVTGTGRFEAGTLELSGKVVQEGTYTMNSAPDYATSYSVSNEQSIVVVVSGKKCTLKSFRLNARNTQTSPETSRHYAGRIETTVTYHATPSTKCTLY
ncbi:hypothetical protein J2858_003592 [Neorhizobium galegae]|uniref:hypothetical protein n=1 Tax=Neorhizobium galegae TaxID=399 RepID=UPI001AE5A83B|nr:hypothetical protein [Neorhizobium galegae]MBP2550652.1 hypothetical protein [Neorhizobium galegae]